MCNQSQATVLIESYVIESFSWQNQSGKAAFVGGGVQYLHKALSAISYLRSFLGQLKSAPPRKE